MQGFKALLGDTASLAWSIIGNNVWHATPLARKGSDDSNSSNSGDGFFFVPADKALAAGNYEGAVCVAHAGPGGDKAHWMPVPIAGLATKDNECGDGGRNALFTIPTTGGSSSTGSSISSSSSGDCAR